MRIADLHVCASVQQQLDAPVLSLPDGEDQRREALRVLPIDKLEAGMVLACTGEQDEQFR